MQRRTSGFTLVELLVTLAVIALLAGTGIPGLERWVAASRLAAWTTTYAQALHTMRHIAVESGRHVSLCELGRGDRCTGRWGPRLVLFFDDDRDGQLASRRDIIMDIVMPGEDARLDVSWRGFGERRFLNVRATGAFRQNGRFRLCPAAGTADHEGREIVLNVTGRLRVAPFRCG